MWVRSSTRRPTHHLGNRLFSSSLLIPRCRFSKVRPVRLKFHPLVLSTEPPFLPGPEKSDVVVDFIASLIVTDRLYTVTHLFDRFLSGTSWSGPPLPRCWTLLQQDFFPTVHVLLGPIVTVYLTVIPHNRHLRTTPV